MIDFEKLRHEWKTFAWGVLSLAVELWDNVLASALNLDTIIPAEYQNFAHVAIPVGFFLLRRWKAQVEQ